MLLIFRSPITARPKIPWAWDLIKLGRPGVLLLTNLPMVFIPGRIS